MAFRYDKFVLPICNNQKHFQQHICLVRLNSDFKPIGQWVICKELGNRAYDPRLVQVDNQIFLSFSSAGKNDPHSSLSSHLCLTLWLDLAMHPLWDLEDIFETIVKNGCLCTEAGFPLDYPYGLGQHLPNAVRALNVSLDQLPLIRHLSSQIIGLDTSNHHVNQFLDEWLKETLKVETCINWYPEELCYSVVAWRNNIRPTCHFGEVVFTRANYSKEIRWNRQFYWDENRENKTQWDPRILDE